MRELWTAALAIGVAAGLTAAGDTVAAEPIRIGVMGPQTGPAARVGDDIRNGVHMGREEALADGDLPVAVGGELRDFEFVWVDSESSPEKGIRAVRRAITEDEVDILMFGWHSSVGLAVIDVSAEYGKIHFGPLPATHRISEKIIDNGYTHYFKGWPVIGAWPSSTWWRSTTGGRRACGIPGSRGPGS